MQAKALYMAGARVILSGRREAELERVRSACIEQGSAARVRDIQMDLKDPLVLPLDLRSAGASISREHAFPYNCSTRQNARRTRSRISPARTARDDP